MGNLSFAGSLLLHGVILTIFSFWPAASESLPKTQQKVVQIRFLPAPTAEKETQNSVTEKIARFSPTQPIAVPSPAIPTLMTRTPRPSTPEITPEPWIKRAITSHKRPFKPRRVRQVSLSKTAKPARSTKMNHQNQNPKQTTYARSLPTLNKSFIKSAQPMRSSGTQKSSQPTVAQRRSPSQPASIPITPTLFSQAALSIESSEDRASNIQQRPDPALPQTTISTEPSRTVQQAAQSFTSPARSGTQIAALPRKSVRSTLSTQDNLDANLNAVRGLFTGKVRERIAEAKHYPRIARRREMEGQPIVSFTLNKNGGVMKADLSQTSGYQLLDRAALEAVQQAAPYPKIPEELQTNTYHFKLPISFVLK